MKRFSTLMMVAAVLLLQSMFCMTAQAARYGDVTVSEQAAPRPTRHVHGYVEYRFALFNDSTDKERAVRLTVPGSSWGSSGKVTRTVTLLPKSQGLVSMWQPPVDMNGNGVSVHIDGRLQEEMLNLEVSSSMSSGSSYEQAVLFSQGVDSRFRDRLSELKKDMGYGGGVSNEFGQRTTVPLNQWSESWLGYSAFDGVVMTQSEWRTLPPRVLDAICSWIEAGGSLLVIGTLDVPARWQGRLGPWYDVSVDTAKATNIGRGIVATATTEHINSWAQATFSDVHTLLWSTDGTTSTLPMAISDANTTFPVTDSLGVPARGMLAIMLLFAILIGPVNMVVFAKLNKRLWTLVTIPAAAVLFSACVFAYTMLADGISASGRAQSMTVLDQKNHHATTAGWLGYYAPLQPSDGLHFDLDTELTPQIGDVTHSYRGNEVTSRFIDWSTDQHLTTGWVSSRIPAHFTFRKSQSRRERLQVTQDAQNNVTVVNGLGSDVLTLQLTDAQGRRYSAQGTIAAGQQAKLVPENMAVTSVTSLTPFADRSNWRSVPSQLEFTNYSNYENQENTYVATLHDPVFIEQGLTKLKSFKTQSTVYGLFEMNNKEGE